MGAQTRDHSVDITVEHLGGVGDRLPDAQLDVVLGQRRGRAAEPGDAHLERDTRPVRWLLEEHGKMAALKRPFRPLAGLDLVGQVEELAQLPPVEVGEVDEVATLQRNHRSDHDRSPDYRPRYRRGSISSPATIGGMATSRNESNSGSRERSLGPSRSRRIRSRQAAGASPNAAGWKLSGVCCLISIVTQSVTRRL